MGWQPQPHFARLTHEPFSPVTNDTTRTLFLAFVGVLLGVGTMMVHSASITSWPTEFERVYLSRHVLFVAIGVVAACVAGLMPARAWKGFAPWFVLLSVGLLVAVLIPGVGTRVKGAQRWLRFAGFSMQPSEIAKIALPICLAMLLERNRHRLGHWFHGTLPILLPVLVLVPLVLVEPDLGNAIFLILIATTALWIGGWPLRNFIVGAVVAIPAAASLLVMRPYQMRRITGFLDTWADLDKAPYQVKESLYTLGSGGLFGTGVGKGTQKLSFLPEANTDFVIAVIGEELGLVGTLALLAVWVGLFVTGLKLVARQPRGSFAHIAAFTLLVQVVLQAAINVAVVTAMVPPKGIPHPLVSYGGSNLVCTLVAIGLVVGLTTRDQAAESMDVLPMPADPDEPPRAAAG